MKTAILIGSIRIGRQSHKIAYYLQRKLEERNADVDIIDLAEIPVPMMEERAGRHPRLPESVSGMGRRLQAADAIILVSPEYHGSFSGVLKNALDYFWAEFKKKPVAVVTTSGGKMGGINATTQLQHVVLHMGAFALPQKLLVPDISNAFSDDFEPSDKNIVISAEKFLEGFLWFATAIYHAKQPKLIA